jgi:hypothetical protein
MTCVEARVEALLKAVDNNPLERIRPCDFKKLIDYLKLRNACGIDGIPNECLRYFPRRPLVNLTHLIQCADKRLKNADSDNRQTQPLVRGCAPTKTQQ